MKYTLVIFDLDGTLLNTLDDLADAANAALAEYGFPPRTTEEIRTFVGNGVSRLIHRAVPEGTDEAVAAAVLARFKAIYLEHVNDKTVPYPGIPSLLRALNDRGVRCAVNSNKVDDAVQLLCYEHFDGLLDIALGEREGIPRKPAPDGARRIMRRFGVRPEATLYVGDGEADLCTAQNAGIDCAWVSWGFRRPHELDGLDIPNRCDSAGQLRALILGY
ncbi:MAG: HAD family hydrolase [Clostridia bacterium]|nr:HAD family hydrolase [Clostridia bacterium]